MRWLVVDDDALARLLHVEWLKEVGHEVVEAADGAAALEAMAQFEPDAIVMDVRMPHMDGWTAARTIRAGAQDPIIVLATGHLDDATRAQAAQIDAYALEKPFSERDIAWLKQLTSRRVEQGVSFPTRGC